MTHRLTWDDFPPVVRRRLEVLLGAPVERTRSCTGGFSPSSAEILTAHSGRELFVKAVRGRDNPGSLQLNRDEAAVLAALPATSRVPSLVDSFMEGEWFVLVTEVAPGSLPKQPWTAEQLDMVLQALDALQALATPSPVGGLRLVTETLGPDMLGFDRVAADPPEDLDPWLRDRLDELRAAARRGIDALDGDSLCHSDVRADNILLADDGGVSLVDWAWASRGSRISDALQLLSSVEDPEGVLGVNARVDAALDSHELPHRVGTDVLVGVLGFFVDAERRSADSSLTFLQRHRRARRDSLLPLVRERWA